MVKGPYVAQVVDRVAVGAQAALQVPDATLPCRLIHGTTATSDQQDRQMSKVNWVIG
jgi:hypothetical protein